MKKETMKKRITLLEKELNEVSKRKITREKYTSEEQRKEMAINKHNKLLVEALSDYQRYKNFGKKITINKILEIHKINIHMNTFSNHWKYFKVHNKLRPHGNKNRLPSNKIDLYLENVFIDGYLKLIEVVEEHHTDDAGYFDIKVMVTHIHKKVTKILMQKHSETEWFKIISYSTFYRRLKELMFIGKKTHKVHKAIIKKKKLLISKIKDLKKRFEKFEVENDEMMIQKAKEKTKEEEKVKREKRDPRLVDVLPGEIVEADGSFDPLYKGKTICRVQISDSKTSDVMAINFEKQETNKSYIEAIKQMLDLGIPKIWLCDLRKGVDPSDDGAFVALLLQNLGITINANSNSNHKAVVESSNGNAHSFFAIEFAVENIRTLKEAKSRQIELKKEFNLTNGRKEKIDYSHLKQLTQRQRDFIYGDMDKLKIKLSDGIYYKKKGYIAVDQNDKPIYIQRGEFVLISKLKNNKFQIWINGIIYDLKKVTDKVEIADMTFEQIFEDIKDRTFIKNNVAMMNNETLQYLIKESFKNGIKVGRNKKSWTA